MHDPLTATLAQIEQHLMQLSVSLQPEAEFVAGSLETCRQAMAQGRAAFAIPLLQALAKRLPQDARVLQRLGYALHLEQRLIEADEAFSKAIEITPQETGSRFGLAQMRFELGRPAAALFKQAAQSQPDNLEMVRNQAAALATEGDILSAEQLLTSTLTMHPDWLDGHKVLATLRWTSGDRAHFADSYAAACKTQPRNAALWLAWFSNLAQTRNWPAAQTILDAAEQQLGTTPAITVARLFIASESGDDHAATTLFDQTRHIQGEVINLCRIRYLLRQRRPQEAQEIALSLITGPSAALFWPYLSVIWRLTKDERALWLDNPEAFIQHCDVGMSQAELDELASVLRTLHTAQAPYIEQSVRGGTQTDRSVLLRHEPILQLARQRLLAAIRAYIAELPAADHGHPLLGVPRNHLLIEGSWSVRLLQQGYNVPHTHPMGWLSTAFYVSLPAPAQLGPAPAGHIEFGTPPTELGLELPPYRHIEPRAGRLAIFPSTMWHGTVPFNDGERLVIAFDIRRPRY
jgi:tetratricopeptide (TPR) repeat protein